MPGKHRLSTSLAPELEHRHGAKSTINGTTWGWVHLLLGILVFLAGFGVLTGQTWARVIGIILVSISAILNFGFIPWAPFWAITIIAIDVWIIHALAVYRPQEF